MFWGDDDDDDGCRCGMCGPFGASRGLGMIFSLFGGFDDYDHDPWRNRREKSGAAEMREERVKNKFRDVKKQVESTLMEKKKVSGLPMSCFHPIA
jgi:hypothetical protein